MKLPFTKMHGLGNDYVYFDCVKECRIVDPGKLAPIVADRHFGVGGDGIVLILPHAEADFRMRMFNADGSEAEMCGNAIRCVGKYVYDRGYHAGESVRIMTGNGILTLELTIDGEVATHARVAMGKPILNGPDIPIALEANPVIGASVEVDGEAFTFTGVSMGNPHAVIAVEAISDALVLGAGPKLEVAALFPRRINVEFIRVLNRREVEMRVWERGSGETLACGTGACAVGVACILNGWTERELTVHLRGGDLQIAWPDDHSQVYMTGPATHVFTGTLTL